jgi:hypothetical protein
LEVVRRESNKGIMKRVCHVNKEWVFYHNTVQFDSLTILVWDFKKLVSIHNS